jgi:hypothetical protein
MADDTVFLTVPMWHVLTAAKAWYKARAEATDLDVIEQAEIRLFEATRSLEVAEALERSARRAGRPSKIRLKRRRSMLPPPVEGDIRMNLRVIEGGKSNKE